MSANMQAGLEKAVGIDANYAARLNADSGQEANQVRSLLKMQINQYDPSGFALLKCAVDAHKAKEPTP